MDKIEICRLSASEMAKAIRERKLSPVEVVEAVLDCIEELNPIVNAYCTLAAESALKRAREAEKRVVKGERLGPLEGVPVSIKDLLFTQGIRTTAGSKIYQNFIPEEDAIAVARLKKAGAIIIGKTNVSEFGWVAITDNLLFGATRNPWNVALTPGGSSGGAAASVALGMGPIALASDGGGSIRIPSSFCGVFGFKPSFGRVPHYPSFPGWETLEHIGPITRTVEDAALVMEIIAGRDERDPFSLPEDKLEYLPALKQNPKGLKIAWSGDLGYATVDPQVLSIAEAGAEVFERLGCKLERASPKATPPEEAFSTLVSSRLLAVLEEKLEEKEDELDPALVRFLKRNRDKRATEYVRAHLELIEYSRKLQLFFEKYDLLLTPTVAVSPFELGSFGPREISGNKVSPLGWMPFTYPFNITGQPAASLPCGWTKEGLPVGLQLIGQRFDDAAVLKAAAAFERASPWEDKWPPLLDCPK